MEEKENIEEQVENQKSSPNKKRVIILILLTLITVSVIFYIKFYMVQKDDIDIDVDLNSNSTEIMKCIADNSELYVSTNCGHCASQKVVLGDYLELFTIINCLDNATICYEKEIKGVPTWIINNTKYEGIQQIDQLLNLTGCGKWNLK